MITVAVTKRAGLTALFERVFADAVEAARFAESWLPMHVMIRNEAGQDVDTYHFLRLHREPKETQAERYAGDAADNDPPDAPYQALGEICPFCGESELAWFADDECLNCCGTCDRSWYIDHDENVLPADRCPSCESPDVSVDGEGVRTCGKCRHRFFFDGLTYVDPDAGETDGEGC